MDIETLRKILVGEKPNKYKAVKTVVDGIAFHSKKEAKRYADLLIRERAGEIIDIRIQPFFHLTVKGVSLGKYILDFMYRDLETDEIIYEDVKAWDKKKNKWLVTRLSAWKKKHIEIEYKIKVDYV